MSLRDRVRHEYADSSGVRIHYVTLGQGPLIVMIHGFPGFWYCWRHQMEALASQFKVAAVDLRGYNRSDKPQGVDSYAMRLLVGDIVAVIRHLREETAIVAGHDWGGAISWALAMFYPEMVEKLIICNLPHPRGLLRELATNPEQKANSEYARNFQKEGAHKLLTAEWLAQWISDPDARAQYIEAHSRSDFEAMLNYYKANYPREPYVEDTSPVTMVKCPVLMIHGLKDKYLLAAGLNDTWEWLEGELTLLTLPEAGHFVMHDAPDRVTDTIRMWLHAQTTR